MLLLLESSSKIGDPIWTWEIWWFTLCGALTWWSAARSGGGNSSTEESASRESGYRSHMTGEVTHPTLITACLVVVTALHTPNYCTHTHTHTHTTQVHALPHAHTVDRSCARITYLIICNSSSQRTHSHKDTCVCAHNHECICTHTYTHRHTPTQSIHFLHQY